MLSLSAPSRAIAALPRAKLSATVRSTAFQLPVWRSFQSTATLDSVRVLPSGEWASRLRAQDLSSVQQVLKFSYKDISSNPDKWMACVQELNARSHDRPLSELDGPQGVALLTTLLKAGHSCQADLESPQFAMLPINLLALGKASFRASDRHLIAELAKSAIETACATLPSSGSDFVSLSGQEREASLNSAMRNLLAHASRIGLGPREQDKDALTSIIFTGHELEAGAFGVDDKSASLFLAEDLVGDSLRGLLDRDHKALGLSSPSAYADRLLTRTIATMAHELYHAFQYSQLDADTFASDPEFFGAQSNKLSMSAEKFIFQNDQYMGVQDPDKEFLLFPHERGSWYTTCMVLAAMSGSPRMPEGLRQAAAGMLAEPRVCNVAATLLGLKQPAKGTFEPDGSGQLTLSAPVRTDVTPEQARQVHQQLSGALQT